MTLPTFFLFFFFFFSFFFIFYDLSDIPTVIALNQILAQVKYVLKLPVCYNKPLFFNHGFLKFYLGFLSQRSNLFDLPQLFKDFPFFRFLLYLQVIFEGIAGSSYTGDIAIDDVAITSGSCDNRTVFPTSPSIGGKYSPR